MILNEDYFNDLEIEDEDIIEDDINDVGGPEHDLTLEEAQKLPDQYNQVIEIRIDAGDSTDTTSIKTSVLPKLFKRLDIIFEMYDIEHSEYILTPRCNVGYCDTIVEFGNYQLFCDEEDKNDYVNDTYDRFYIQVYVNYPNFNYKRAFRFLYTVINLYRDCEQMNWMSFTPNTTNGYVIKLQFWTEKNHIRVNYYNTKGYGCGTEIILSKELIEKYKREFYRYVIRYFFGKKVQKIDYEAIDRDVPIKPIRPLEF